MTRNEAVQKLATAGRLSIARAEDLYDSLVPKPVVPQYVADWYEGNKVNFEANLMRRFKGVFEFNDGDDFQKWVEDKYNKPFQTLVNMHQFGYEVEGEPRYMVRIKGIDDRYDVLNHGTYLDEWTIDDAEGAKGVRTTHTRKELEEADFEWVFDCPGVEVKEVE